MEPAVFDIDADAFWHDPYPIFAVLRREAPIAWIPQVASVAFTRYDDISRAEKNVAVFSSHQPEGLMNRLMGHNMMRKDGRDHVVERKIILRALSTRVVREHWHNQFQTLARGALERIAHRDTVDLVSEFAMAFSAECLKAMTGLTDTDWREFDSWSQRMIDGISNYTGDPEVEARCRDATAAIDAAIERRLREVKRKPDGSLISVFAAHDMPVEGITANIKLTISGGQNEPRDAIAGAIWALLTHREALDAVRSGQRSWEHVFDEYLRWVSPIGMSPRRVARNAEFDGVDLKAEQRVFFLFGSANRDESVYTNPDTFDIHRDASRHLAFGAGPHYCAGAWASKTMIADVALPAFFARFPRVELAGDVPFGGWAFRGPLCMPVALNR